jgi:hypothetical protein
MIQTLRITGVAAVALAGVVLASVLGPVSLIQLDAQGNQRMESILTAPSAVERFREQNGGKGQVDLDTTPPLVRQAETFKDIIDPRPVAPPASKPVATTPPPRPPVVKPQTTSQKFELIGTSYSPWNPALSFAYIRLPDGAFQWIPSGGHIGHLVVKEIRQGSIICSDGRTDTEIRAESVPDTANLLRAGAAEKSASAATGVPQPVEARVVSQAPMPPRPPGKPASPWTQQSAPKLNEQEQEALSDLVSRLKELERHSGGNPPGAGVDANGPSPEYGSSRLSPEEARKLENLGQRLSGDRESELEEAKRELIRRLNAAHSSRN